MLVHKFALEIAEIVPVQEFVDVAHFGCEDGLCRLCAAGHHDDGPQAHAAELTAEAATAAGGSHEKLKAVQFEEMRQFEPADAAPPDVLASVHQYAAMQLWSDGWSVDDIAEVMALNPDIVRRLVH